MDKKDDGKKIERTLLCTHWQMNLRKIDGCVLYWSWRVLNGTFSATTRAVRRCVCVRANEMDGMVGSWLAMREDTVSFFVFRSFGNNGRARERVNKWVSKWLRSVCFGWKKGYGHNRGPNRMTRYGDGGDVTTKSMLLYVFREQLSSRLVRACIASRWWRAAGVRLAFDEKYSKRRWKGHNWSKQTFFSEIKRKKASWNSLESPPPPRRRQREIEYAMARDFWHTHQHYGRKSRLFLSFATKSKLIWLRKISKQTLESMPNTPFHLQELSAFFRFFRKVISHIISSVGFFCMRAIFLSAAPFTSMQNRILRAMDAILFFPLSLSVFLDTQMQKLCIR